MYSFTIRLSEVNINIFARYPETKEFCRDYLTDENADVTLTVTQNDIDFERNMSVITCERKGVYGIELSDKFLETLAVYRKIADKIQDFDTLLMHGSAIAVDGVCYIFIAKSGTGKSTHTRLWREYFGDRAIMVNDDKPLIKITNDQINVFGTPWNGKHKLGHNISVPLKSICILNRDISNHIETVSKRNAWMFLLQQTYRPDDVIGTGKVLKLLDTVASRVQLYSLGCNMDAEAVKVSYCGMNSDC